MNNEVITKAREVYRKEMQIKKELLEVKEELSHLEPTENIQDCLKIISKEEGKFPSDEEILRFSFYNVENENSQCNIYVFIGAYRRNNKNGNDTLVSNYIEADYFVYQNLEKMFSGVVIYPQEYKKFEQDNIVLRFTNLQNIREKFYELQCIYFSEYLHDENISQDKILEKLKEKL